MASSPRYFTVETKWPLAYRHPVEYHGQRVQRRNVSPLLATVAPAGTFVMPTPQPITAGTAFWKPGQQVSGAGRVRTACVLCAGLAAECVLLLQKSRVWFPAHIGSSDGSPAPGH